MTITYLKAWYSWVHIIAAYDCPEAMACNECVWIVPGTEEN